MSLATKRQEIANALSTVTGVVGFPYRPTQVSGNNAPAWPLLGPIERGPGQVFEYTWRVRVALPPDEVAASQWIDGHLDNLYDALMSIGYIDRIDTTPLALNGSDTYALEITMRSE